MSDREAMKLALEALELWRDAYPNHWNDLDKQAAEALLDALAAPRPEPEPVAYFDLQKQVFYWARYTMIDVPMTVAMPPLPLYAAPPAAAPDDAEALRRDAKRLRGLLAEAQKAVWMNYDGDLLDRIEAALREPAIQPAIQPAIRARGTLERLNDAASQSD